jgi:hypothetical protein
MESKKQILIASFVPKLNIEWFMKYLKEKFNIDREFVFVYEICGNDLDYLLTFKLKNDKKIDLKFHFNNATIVNTKSGCVFSINGLNRLIEEQNGCDIGNINYTNHYINWSEHCGKLILSNKNQLSIKKIKKIKLDFNKNCF